MDAKEFATRMVTDEDFMLEIIKQMPDSVFEKNADEDDMARGMVQVAAERGWNFSEPEIKQYYNEALQSQGFLGIFKYLRRFSRVAKAAGKSKKDLKARRR